MLADLNKRSESFDKLETDYLKVIYHEFPEKYSGLYKSSEYSTVFTVIKGAGYICKNNNKKYAFDSSQFILLPPEASMSIDIDAHTKYLELELKDELLRYVNEKVSIDFSIDCYSIIKDNFLLGSSTPVIKECFSKTVNIILNPDKNIGFLLDLYAQELAYNLMQIKGADQILSIGFQSPINMAIKYMYDNLSEPISLRKIAAGLNMSESSFSQCFKRATGITPKEYLTNIKLSKAKDMIFHSSVSEVAYDLGYDNISHFISLFKSKYGMTPKQYKKKAESMIDSYSKLN